MKKRFFMLVVFGVIGIVSILFLIPMINYVITFDEMSSFMTFDGAIITVICLFIALLGSLTGIVMLTLNIKRQQLNSNK